MRKPRQDGMDREDTDTSPLYAEDRAIRAGRTSSPYRALRRASGGISLYSCTRPSRAMGGERSLDQCIARWRSDLRRTHACRNRARHAFVSYERLVDDASRVLTSLCASLGLSINDDLTRAMLNDYQHTAADVTQEEESWKMTVGSPIQNRNKARAGTLSPETEAELRRQIAEDDRLLDDLPFL